MHEAAHFFRGKPGQLLVDVENQPHLQPLGGLERFEQARKLEQRRHARAVVIRPDCALRRIVMGPDHDETGLSRARAGAPHLEISNLHALRFEFLAGDRVAQARERHLDVTRGAFERFGMSGVVLFARHGDDVRLEVREELPVPDAERLQRTPVARAGHRRHEPDGECGECDEDREDGECDTDSRGLQGYSGQFLI